MKSATICFICKKLVKTVDTYNVQVEETTKQVTSMGTNSVVTNKFKTKICRKDAKLAGYKVKKTKKPVKKEVIK
jgi:hypothetical protein